MFGFAMLSLFVFSFLCTQTASSLQTEGGKLSTYLSGQAEHSHKRILLIGSSVDRYAQYFYCNQSNATVFADTVFTRSLDDGLQLAQGCFTEHFTLAYMFIPGSGPPPYYWCQLKPTLCGDNSLLSPGMTHATSHEIIEFDAPDFAGRSLGGFSPDIVMIESSNWDVAAWHANDRLGNSSGWPPSVLETHVRQWSDYDIPALLDVAQKAFPQSRIFTHTPARPVFDCGSGQSQAAFDMLTSSLLSKVDENGLLYGKYAYVDYYRIIADILLPKLSAGIDIFKDQNTYLDCRHPGTEPAVAYINHLLEIA
eukprot:TRINITY_DN1020_c0_g3_i1.p1 TRINITY_DN1020_c0_g3~~TRINITY_DN1020_c0_g3_i1.p1  ORF type:complete len:309 (-),score=28.51 TRINITY_DN1020_c0_g3_i1:51-977(-)